MTDPREPLPPALDALLELERPLDPVADRERARLRAGVMAAVGGASPPPSAPRSAGPSLVRRSRAVQAALGMLVLGGAAGFLVGRATARGDAPSVPTVASAPVALSIAAPTTGPGPSTASTDAGPPAGERLRASDDRRPAPVAAAPPRASATPGERDAGSTEGLTSERTLLDRARSAMLRGDPAAALQALDEHARAYPAGALVEEREYLAIRALVAEGRRDQALDRAERYRATFGLGLFGERIEGELRRNDR